jgi:hypothetical protein
LALLPLANTIAAHNATAIVVAENPNVSGRQLRARLINETNRSFPRRTTIRAADPSRPQAALKSNKI